MKADDRGAEVAGWRELRDGLGEVLVGLADIQMRTILTTTMAPAIYVLCALGVAGINAWLAVLAFGQSLQFGLVWLILVMPVMLLSGLVIVRVVLEVILSIFRILVNMESMMEQVRTLRGQTETIVGRTDEIVEDLPRIQFWRSRKRYSSKGRDTDGDADGAPDDAR